MNISIGTIDAHWWTLHINQVAQLALTSTTWECMSRGCVMCKLGWYMYPMLSVARQIHLVVYCTLYISVSTANEIKSIYSKPDGLSSP